MNKLERAQRRGAKSWHQLGETRARVVAAAADEME